MANMNSKSIIQTSDNQLDYRADFEKIFDIISFHKNRAMKVIHNESLLMVWEVGGYISNRLKQSAWGDSVVRILADYIRMRNPKAKGWSYRTLYKMVQFYDTYSSDSFKSLVEHYDMQQYLSESSRRDLSEIVPIQLAQLSENEFVPTQLAQIPTVLLATGWSNHQLNMSKSRTNEQRLFYMLYAAHEQLEYDELKRAFATDAMNSVLGSK